jgi:phospholipid/cholesterol/gamma-HCH transport system substrate-binding protein
VALADVIHDFGLLTTELGRHDAAIERWVTSSKGALGNFANQQSSIQEILTEFPSTLTVAQSALASANAFSKAARPALLGLIPQAQALKPALKANQRLFEQTVEPIRTQIRPFTREVRPVLTHANQGSAAFSKTVRGFGNSLSAFNSFLNELAYKPKGKQQSYLFYLPWLNHDTNATFNLADPAGPISRSLVMISCNGTSLAYGFATDKPYIQSLLNGANIPRKGQLPPIKSDPTFPGHDCGPETE